MLETFLFITPWGDECFKCEKETIHYFKHAEEKVDFKIITVLNMNIILKFVKRNQIEEYDFNNLFTSMYLTALDYKAANYQGKAIGRRFMLALQNAIIEQSISYSPELGTTIARQTGLDVEMFETDRQSRMVREEFKRDQQLAHEMDAENIPSAVIFNLKDEDCGVLLEHYDYQTLASVCHLKVKSTDTKNLLPPEML
jgi:predicted DsbA family dithiol-disulfide isomerase